MAYTKLPFENGITPLNKDLFDHLQNGIADVDERLANGGGGGASGGGIIDVTELPTTNIDEKSIYRVPHEGGAEVWMVMTEGDVINRMNVAEGLKLEGFNEVIVELVDTLPETLTPLDEENLIAYIYVVKSTGIAYADFGDVSGTIGMILMGAEGYDHGWTTDINAETEVGVYCVHSLSYSYHACKGGVWTEFVDKNALNASGGRVVLTINLADLIANGNVQIPDSDIERLKANFENSAIKMISGTDIVVLNPAECYTNKMYYSSMSKTDQGYSLTVGWLQTDGISWGFAFINKPILNT